jgi:hypothetical protein
MRVRIQASIACQRIRNDPSTLWERVIELPERPLVGDCLLLNMGAGYHEFGIRQVTWDEQSGQYVVHTGVQWISDDHYDEFVRLGLWESVALYRRI